MERTIDRTSYRRSVNIENETQNIKTKKTYTYANIILDQIIISLIIMIGILCARFFEIDGLEKWVANNISSENSIIESFSITKNKLLNKIDEIENAFEHSGDNLVKIDGITEKNDEIVKNSGECSGEIQIVNENELKSAVEGINQMENDIELIKENYNLIKPVEGVITSKFGARNSNNPIISTYHAGLDIGTDQGKSIVAAHNGKVILAKMYSSYGNCIMIENDKLITVYAHCSAIGVNEGQFVNAGEYIGKVGMTGNATGPHLHFEIRYDGRFIDPEKIIEF